MSKFTKATYLEEMPCPAQSRKDAQVNCSVKCPLFFITDTGRMGCVWSGNKVAFGVLAKSDDPNI